MGAVPALDELVEVPGGRYELGEPGAERVCTISALLIGRWPVVNAHVRRFAAATGHPVPRTVDAEPLTDHPATGLSLADAEAFCGWASEEFGRPVRLPTSDEWEAAARGTDGRPYPWGETFDPERCACAESGWGWTVPVAVHPAGAGPFGAEQQAGNVWEWVADRRADGWGIVRGGSYLDTGWGLRASRVQPAEPERATNTTGFRICIGRPDAARLHQSWGTGYVPRT
jgi:formylglycine-generating enzyme required for sulfatase activity